MSIIPEALSDWLEKKLQRRRMKKKGLVQPKSKKRLRGGSPIGRAAEESRIVGIVILFTVWCFCVAVLVMPPVFGPVSSIISGQEATATVFAEMDFSYVDEEATGIKRQKLMSQVPLVYQIDYTASDECIETAKAVFDAIVASSDGMEAEVSNGYDPRLAKAFKSLDPLGQRLVLAVLVEPKSRKDIIDSLQTALFFGIACKEERFRKNDFTVRIHKTNIREKPRKFAEIPTPEEVATRIAGDTAKGFAPENRDILKKSLEKILNAVVKDDLVYDGSMTDSDRSAAVADMTPIKRVIKEGEVLLSKGQVVHNKNLAIYNEYLTQKQQIRGRKDFYRNFFVNAFLCMVIMCLSGIYISHIHPEITESNHKMGLVGTVVILAVLTNYFTIELFGHIRPVFDLHPHLLFSLIPMAMVSIILSPMLGLRVAHYAGLFVSIITAMQLDDSFPILINGMLICGISGFFVRHRPNHRSYFLYAALVVALGTPALSLMQLWAVEGNPSSTAGIVAFGVLNGVFTAIFSLVLLFILEIVFQISSDMTLLLLCDYNHPLLKRLQLEAPGTYHHSLVVSTLAEHAANAIHANPIRARVIALFHDIGKMVKPEYFAENQYESDSKHSRLNPRMSSLVILNHVKEGLDMALKHKLRKSIRDGIQQHHGTDVVFFFYKQALEEARLKNTTVDENDFRYPGPLPREKEVVILSLADAAEAASRSLQKPSPQKIDALIWEIFRKRIRTGQLDNANLTFWELSKIRESFVSTLTTMMHGRIAYPKDQEDDDDDDLFMAADGVQASEEAGSFSADF
ncbi:MAG: HDIG domain-containing protein [Victivallales bacterium]|nr:HDIG domain-containing protein [Victivallales bacterium]